MTFCKESIAIFDWYFGNFETFSSTRVDPPPILLRIEAIYQASPVQPWFPLRKLLAGHTTVYEYLQILQKVKRRYKERRRYSPLKLMKNSYFLNKSVSFYILNFVTVKTVYTLQNLKILMKLMRFSIIFKVWLELFAIIWRNIEIN